MEDKWQKDNLFGGMTANAFKLGTVLSGGWFWMRPSGCVTVYRGQDGNMDYEDILAVMDESDEQVSLANQALDPHTIWHYIRRRVSDCGLESSDSMPVICRIDGDGELMLDIPNRPLNLVAAKLAGAVIRLKWTYSRINEETAATGFKIYVDSGAGFDFDSPDDSVSARHGRGGYFEWDTDELVHGQLYRFVVRAYASGEGETQNSMPVSAVADSQGPDAITGLRASFIEV